MAVPVVGVASSAILLGEEVTTALAIGLILVIVGVALNLLSDKEALDPDQPSEVV
jgi:drug/metabolite transporter (DMT)-like permease